MNICVYGAASNTINKVYIEAMENLGSKMAKRGHTLVFGGGAEGVMGAVARGVESQDGNTIGITPEFFNVDGMLFLECDEMIKTNSMRERKQLLEDKSDAFIVAPGGIGTFDEFFEILTLKQLVRHSKAIVLFNVNGYFDDLLNMMERGYKEEFIKRGSEALYTVLDDADEVLDYIENYVPQELDILNLRNN